VEIDRDVELNDFLEKRGIDGVIEVDDIVGGPIVRLPYNKRS